MQFNAISTERLLIREFASTDVDGLVERRNDPEVAKYQNWPTPFSAESANAMVGSIVAMDGPANDEWWMAIVCDRENGEVFGDLAVHLSWEGRSAEVGYNFSPRFWGRGYASEALGSLIDWLFANGVARAFGMLHPDNTASAMVLERVGMLFEGHTIMSYWDPVDGPSDDWIYGMTRPDRERWVNRITSAPEEVSLAEITPGNLDEVYRLRTHKSQEAFVAPVPRSIAQGAYPGDLDGHPIESWLRAILADGVPAGFVMMVDRTDHHPRPFLWRLLIDREHQRRGIGSRALDLVVEYARASGASELDVSWHQGKGSPEAFYLSYGFEPTGRILEDEVEGRLRLS